MHVFYEKSSLYELYSRSLLHLRDSFEKAKIILKVKILRIIFLFTSSVFFFFSLGMLAIFLNIAFEQLIWKTIAAFSFVMNTFGFDFKVFFLKMKIKHAEAFFIHIQFNKSSFPFW